MLAKCQQRHIKNIMETSFFDYVSYLGLFTSMPKNEFENLHKCWLKAKTGEILNLEHPQTFNEKIIWISINEHNKLKTQLTDKYLVRDYIIAKIGEKYLVPLYGVWDKFDEIDFDKLPDQFVLKCNHGCGWNVIVKDKSQLDIKGAKINFDEWITLNYGELAGDLHYMDIVPKIIAEKYIENEEGDLWDYKLWCFNGKLKYIQIDRQRLSHHVQRFYSPEWKPIGVRMANHVIDERILEKPNNLGEMREIAEKLAADFNFVRVDLYLVGGNIYFGELTFTPLGGCINWRPPEINKELGKLLHLI